MSYYTKYTITTEPNNKKVLNTIIEKVLKNTFIKGIDLISKKDYISCEERWYDFQNDIFKISKIFPSVRITVEGNGEDSGDIWTQFWFNGYYYEVMEPAKYTNFIKSNLVKYNSDFLFNE